MKKPVIALKSMTDDEGCLFPILDLGERFLALLDRVELGDFRLMEDGPEREKYDIVFVQGSVVTQENLKNLKIWRDKSKTLVGLGACACLGGIPEIKNYGDKMKAVCHVYQQVKHIENIEIKPLREYVKVDLEIPGCPINAEEFLRCTYELLEGRMPKIAQRSVCYECQINGYRCVLQEGKACLGPMILGGCNAVCLSGHLRCMGCRGPLKVQFQNKSIDNLKKKLHQVIDENKLKRIIQIFGLEDDLYERDNKN